MNCNSCKFWDCFSRDDDDFSMSVGTCRRYPPVLDQVYSAKEDIETSQDSNGFTQPVTQGSEWCGEFKKRK